MFLLDTSVASDFVGPPASMPAQTKAFIEKHGQDVNQLFICSITIGEMSFGRALLHRRLPAEPTKVALLDAKLQALGQFAQPFPVNNHVAREYAVLRANYARGVMPQALDKKLKGKAVETWHQHLPASTLRITENDLWIAAVAVTHDMTLVSRDKDFAEVKKYNPQLTFMQL
ncbi:MAG: type II toxin-antitoxin system VapC family toxin [Methylotenera sp.]|nr:type II toxin-antitoxin system VapC family toxin [Methylotenera sp.]